MGPGSLCALQEARTSNAPCGMWLLFPLGLSEMLKSVRSPAAAPVILILLREGITAPARPAGCVPCGAGAMSAAVAMGARSWGGQLGPPRAAGRGPLQLQEQDLPQHGEVMTQLGSVEFCSWNRNFSGIACCL